MRVARTRYDLREPDMTCAQLLMTQAADAIEELQMQVRIYSGAVDETVKMLPIWIPVTERLPEIDEEVLVVAVNDFDADEKWVSISWLDKDNQWPYAIVTHWMPLPKPPKEET